MSVIPKKVFKLLAFTAALPLCAGVCRAQGGDAAPASTAAVTVPSLGSFNLNVVTDRHGSSMGVDYSLRWDFGDLSRINPFSLKAYKRLNPFSRWDIFDNTRWRFYGLSVNPWRVIVSRGKPDISGAGGPAAGGADGGNGRRSSGRRVWKLSLSPLLQDLQEHLDEDLRRALLDAALDPVSDDWDDVSRAGKKAFMRDLLSLDIWEIPLMDQPEKGIRYISQ